jgi:catechol 2,3-dioxygenase-like lactoylglutathione lyase family enzyme
MPRHGVSFHRHHRGSAMKNKVRLEGLTLSVQSVTRSIDYYCKKLGFKLEQNAAPHFALIRVGDRQGGTIGLLSWTEAKKDGIEKMTAKQKRAIHVELSTDDLDGLYKELRAKGVRIAVPPHDEPWERSMVAYDPDGYSVEFAQGRRGKNSISAK